MKSFFKVLGILLAVFIPVVGGFLAYIQITGIPDYKPGNVELKVAVTPERVARGRIISNMLCKECHLDLKTGKLTGHELTDLPPEFGSAYSRNITQDPRYGIGSWTDGEIAYLLRTGIKRNGRYAPPWMVKLPRMADEDIYSIIAYLRSDDSAVQAENAQDRESEPSFLVKFLCHMAFKPFAYPDHELKAPDIKDRVAYGRYVVQDGIECYACHSASFKTMDENHPEKSQGYLGGGNGMPGLDGKMIYTANLTPDPETGIGKWSEDDFVKALRMGVRPDGRPLRYPMERMPEFSDGEARAIYAYLKTVPPLHNEVQRNLADLSAQTSDGKAIYHKYGCVACHNETGVGLGDLTRSRIDFPLDESLKAWIQDPPSFKPLTKMPPFKDMIKEQDYAPLMAYVRQLSATRQ